MPLSKFRMATPYCNMVGTNANKSSNFFQNLDRHEQEKNYYSDFSVQFKKQNYLDAAQLLSAYDNAKDEMPAVAAIQNAVIFPEGQIANESITFNGKGCKSPSAPLKVFHRDTSLEQHAIVITIADYWGEN